MFLFCEISYGLFLYAEKNIQILKSENPGFFKQKNLQFPIIFYSMCLMRRSGF